MSTIPEGYEAITVGMNLSGRTVRFIQELYISYTDDAETMLLCETGSIYWVNGDASDDRSVCTIPGIEWDGGPGQGYNNVLIPGGDISLNQDYVLGNNVGNVISISTRWGYNGVNINDYMVVKSIVPKYITLNNLQEFLAKCDERYQLRTPQSGYNVHIRSTVNQVGTTITSGRAQYSTDNGGTWNTLTFQNIEGGDSPYAYLPVDLTGVTQIKFRSYKYSVNIYDVWQSDTLSLSLKNTGAKDTYTESDNFILTKEVSDIIVYIHY